MEKTAKSVSAKNNNTEVQTAIEEIAEILCNAIKRYIALPAAVKNNWFCPHRYWIYLVINALYIATTKKGMFMENNTEVSVQRQLLALAQMDKEELISKWKDLFGKNFAYW